MPRTRTLLWTAVLGLCTAAAPAFAAPAHRPSGFRPSGHRPSASRPAYHPRPTHHTPIHHHGYPALPHHHHHHRPPVIVLPAPAPEPVVLPAPAPEPVVEEVPLREVRHLRVANRTGQDITVFVKLSEEGPTYNYSFAPDEVAYLAIDGERLAAVQVFIWAEGEGYSATQYRDSALVMVQAPYRAHAVGTFTFTFNP